MPVLKCSNGKFRIGTGPCIYTSQKNAEKAYRAYLVRKAIKEGNKKVLDNLIEQIVQWVHSVREENDGKLD
jgi:hypothetical protein